jgi:hypothetical protein
MSRLIVHRFARVALMVGVLATAGPLSAQVGIGIWHRKETPTTPGKMTMTVAACCGQGRRLTYHFAINGTATELIVESKFDGTEAPVLMNGKPSGETMAIKWVDDHHTTTILKMMARSRDHHLGELIKIADSWVVGGAGFEPATSAL